MGEPIQIQLPTALVAAAVEPGASNAEALVVRALLDAPHPRSMGLVPIVISRGAELRVTGLAGGDNIITERDLALLIHDGHAMTIQQAIPSRTVGPLCAAWLGIEFASRCEEAGAPELPYDPRAMTPVPELGWYVIDTPKRVFDALDQWYRTAFVAVIEHRSRPIVELLAWVDPNREDTRIALYLSGTAVQRKRELTWWARLERDAGRGKPDEEALLRRVDAACARVSLDGQLSGPWQHVALAARCAERLAPAIDPAPEEPTERAVARAIWLAREAAIHGRPASSSDVEAARRRLRDQIHQRRQGARIRDRVKAYVLDVVESVLAGAEQELDLTHLASVVSSARQVIAEIVYPEVIWTWVHFGTRTDRAVRDDARWLSRRGAGQGVPAEFFERALWPEGPPPAWESRVRQFRDRLFSGVSWQGFIHRAAIESGGWSVNDSDAV